MRYQPSHGGDNRVMTPPALATTVVRRLRDDLYGVVMDPCAGSGAFIDALRRERRLAVRWCELDRGRDFMAYRHPVDWIVTNPPYGDFRKFLGHAMTIASHIAFLVTVNHWWTKRRVIMVRAAGFGYRRLLLLGETPPEWPSTGFQHGVMVLTRGWQGDLRVEEL